VGSRAPSRICTGVLASPREAVKPQSLRWSQPTTPRLGRMVGEEGTDRSDNPPRSHAARMRNARLLRSSFTPVLHQPTRTTANRHDNLLEIICLFAGVFKQGRTTTTFWI
jgi:hypothetical protein